MNITQWNSPDKNHIAKWRWGGEMWMSGPEWGYLSIDDANEFKGASEEAIWSEDSKYFAFVALHIEDVPNRKGAEGMGCRVCVVRIEDGSRRYCFGNLKLAEIKLLSFSSSRITASVNGAKKQIIIDKLQW